MRHGGTSPSPRELAQMRAQGSTGKNKDGSVKRSDANKRRAPIVRLNAPKKMTPKPAPKNKPTQGTLKPVKPIDKTAGTYKGAKKNNANLDKLIARRKNLTKGTPEYNRVQNQINAAYGKGPRRDASIKKLAPKKTATVSSGAKPKLQVRKPVAKPLTPAEKRKKATAAKKATRSNKKDVKKSVRGLSKSMRQIKAVGRKAARSRKQIIRKARKR